ncbi:hypothetical protein SADUNF_Sadunf18G0117500 [Salix dunnii]|uniref:SMP domain-containing protein n=1 Tax=Salix dunnii TaxID=1413687 RepID=A0A835J4R6_9ROSI|nr:hypothetical protein SADUNF_Sadunf18G0117500 [Salix dunnii]
MTDWKQKGREVGDVFRGSDMCWWLSLWPAHSCCLACSGITFFSSSSRPQSPTVPLLCLQQEDSQKLAFGNSTERLKEEKGDPCGYSHSKNMQTSRIGGSHRAIPLTGCVIEAVSATSLPSRKWAKRFPIKVESKTSPIYNANTDEKLNIDEGSLCWNLIISRLYFYAKGNAKVKSLAQAMIQRTLSNMRTPSYIGEVICTDLELGNLPPYIDGIRVLPIYMNEVWAREFDIEYCGGVVPGFETRLEVRDLDMEKEEVNTHPGSSSVSSVRDVSSDLLEGFEHLGKQLNLSEGTVDSHEWENEDKLKDSKSGVSTSTDLSRWKSIRATSIVNKGRISSWNGAITYKPPPSDQLWFGFTSMPDLELMFESSVGEHKITSGQVASFLINKFKAVIR